MSPAQLAFPPNLVDARPRCPSGCATRRGAVGMHGDGLTHRIVPWPILNDQGGFGVWWLTVVGRRYWCPSCHRSCRVAHPGLSHRDVYGPAIAVLLLLLVGLRPLGRGHAHEDAHHLVHGKPLPFSERSRSSGARWTSLRRWVRRPEGRWPGLALPAGSYRARLSALLAAFSPGGTLVEVLDAAMSAQAQGGAAM